MGQFGALYAIRLRKVKRALRDRGQLIGGLSRPILWVILPGIGLNRYFRGEVHGEARLVVPYTYLQLIFPVVIVRDILYTSVQSAVPVIRDREFGFLREILPMPHSLILFGKTQGGATVARHDARIAGARARPFRRCESGAPTDIPYGLGLMFAVTSFGGIIANHIRSFEGLGVFANAMILPLFTSSSVFPLAPALAHAQALVVYPEWLVFLVENNPLTYAVDALGGAFVHFHQFPPSMGPAIIAAMAVGFLLVALYSFGRPRT
jgi:ABC-2 type transport system permease protein